MNHKTTASLAHKDRIKEDLKTAGISAPGRIRLTGTYLPEVIREEERIEAAVFGRQKQIEGFFGIVEGMLVATDQRILYIDHRPGFTTMDEITYDVVSGVNLSTTIFNASVTLYTRVANYHLAYVALPSARKFAEYIEKRVKHIQTGEPAPSAWQPHEIILGNEALTFLEAHEIGVLSTIQRTGIVSGAAIYYVIRNGHPYFVTKDVTHKARDIAGNRHVAFTVYDEQALETIQIKGIAETVSDDDTREDIITSTLRPRLYGDGSHLPPVVRMGAEKNTIVYRIAPTDYSYINFQNISPST